MEDHVELDIPFQPVENSSQIAAIGHDPATNTLAVKFHSGGVYQYPGVTAETFGEFHKAESKGKFFGAYIKGKYTHRRLGAKAN